LKNILKSKQTKEKKRSELWHRKFQKRKRKAKRKNRMNIFRKDSALKGREHQQSLNSLDFPICGREKRTLFRGLPHPITADDDSKELRKRIAVLKGMQRQQQHPNRDEDDSALFLSAKAGGDRMATIAFVESAADSPRARQRGARAHHSGRAAAKLPTKLSPRRSGLGCMVNCVFVASAGEKEEIRGRSALS
jgi:hypothetical protein